MEYFVYHKPPQKKWSAVYAVSIKQLIERIYKQLLQINEK